MNFTREMRRSDYLTRLAPYADRWGWLPVAGAPPGSPQTAHMDGAHAIRRRRLHRQAVRETVPLNTAGRVGLELFLKSSYNIMLIAPRRKCGQAARIGGWMPQSGFAEFAASSALVAMRAGDSELAVAPAAGGAIAWWRTHAGARVMDWLRPARAEAGAARDAGAMGCFPLVPFSNRIREGTFRFGGKSIRLPLNVPNQPHPEHGHSWQATWHVTGQELDALAIEYRHAADAWPFPYAARQTFRLEPRVLAVTIAVENTGQEAMPTGLGLHPYFPRTPLCRLTAPVDGMWRVDDEIMPVELQMPAPVGSDPTNGLMPTKVSLDNGFVGWSGTARIEWPESSAALTIEADAPLRFLVVYSPAAEPYFCVEPVSHCTDAFNLAAQGRPDTGMIVLEPGRSIAATVRFTTVIEQH